MFILFLYTTYVKFVELKSTFYMYTTFISLLRHVLRNSLLLVVDELLLYCAVYTVELRCTWLT